MAVLILGLVLFIGVHSIRMVAPHWRDARIARWGVAGWRAAFAVLSLAGTVLVIVGFELARRSPLFVWTPPYWMPHVTALLTMIAFVLIVANYARGNHLREALGHPLLYGIALWAFAHLLANGTLNDIVLFGALLVWSLTLLVVASRRDRDAGIVQPRGAASRDGVAVVVGIALWAVIVFYLHGLLIGVRPLA